MGRIAVAVLVLSLLLAGAFAHPGWGCGRHKEGRPSLNCREIHPISSSRGFENIIEGHQFVLATFYVRHWDGSGRIFLFLELCCLAGVL
jgi:hypothetical protein